MKLFVWIGAFSLLLAVPLSAQSRAKAWSAPRTPDGHPDLQGVWTNATLTPVERPASVQGKLTLSDQEAKAFEKKEEDELQAQDGASDGPLIAAAGSSGTGGYNVLFIDRGAELARVDGLKRTSLIVDPPDGKIPALTDAAKQSTAAVVDRYDNIHDRPLSERCLLGFSSTAGPPMLPVLYNNNYQIVQTPDHIMILVEMVHDVRIIRMNAQHAPANVRKWLGDSVGHWEGDTLVVDTTNFSDYTTFYEDALDGLQARTAKNLHVVERFQRISADTILYRAAIDDPTTFTRRWTVEYPFLAAAGPVFEYACHEGNYAMTDIMGGARKMEGAEKR
jgi:hypothetical protein